MNVDADVADGNVRDDAADARPHGGPERVHVGQQIDVQLRMIGVYVEIVAQHLDVAHVQHDAVEAGIEVADLVAVHRLDDGLLEVAQTGRRQADVQAIGDSAYARVRIVDVTLQLATGVLDDVVGCLHGDRWALCLSPMRITGGRRASGTDELFCGVRAKEYENAFEIVKSQVSRSAITKFHVVLNLACAI